MIKVLDPPRTFFKFEIFQTIILGNLKPIFHCELGSRWVTNAIEMSTNNMKCTWPTQPIFHLFTLGICVGGNANLYFALGVKQILCF